MADGFYQKKKKNNNPQLNTEFQALTFLIKSQKSFNIKQVIS